MYDFKFFKKFNPGSCNLAKAVNIGNSLINPPISLGSLSSNIFKTVSNDASELPKTKACKVVNLL